MMTAALLLACALPAVAVTPKILVDSGKEGTQPQETGLSVDTKIIFTTSGLQIDNGGNVSSFAYGDVAALRFVTNAVSVAVTGTEGTYALRHNPVKDVLAISGYDGTAVPVNVYSTNGNRVLAITAWQGESIDATTLSAGVYVITVKNETLKFIKK